MAARHFRLLVGLFTRRFFENDLLAPDVDLRPSAIWLGAALATPPALWAVKGILRFGFMIIFGYDVVEGASWYDKSLMMMLAMVNGGIVTLLCWEALLVDRRDALVLGSLPLSSHAIVGAKAVALLRLFALVAALNLPAALILSVAIYSHFGGGLVFGALVAHSVAVTSASVCTCLILTAALVTVTSTFHGRALRALTVVVQTAVLLALSALLLGFQWVPAVGLAARADAAGELGWMAAWPPAWFLGLYQVILGADPGRHVFEMLALRALATMVLAVGLCAPATWLLWRRSLRLAVSASPGEGRGRARGIAHGAPSWLARRPFDRGLIQFLLAVLWRSPRHRLAMLTATGLAAAVAVEATVMLAFGTSLPERTLTEFVAPLVALLVLFAILQWLLTLPAELQAAWTLGLVTPAAASAVRRAVRRVLFLLAVLPPVLLAFGLSWWQANPISAAAHAGLVFLIGTALVERASARLDYMPCATEYVPGRSNLKARWPVHAVVLLFVVPAVAQAIRALVSRPGAAFWIVGVAGVISLAWATSRRRGGGVITAERPADQEWTPVALGVGAAVLWTNRGVGDGNPPGLHSG